MNQGFDCTFCGAFAGVNFCSAESPAQCIHHALIKTLRTVNKTEIYVDQTVSCFQLFSQKAP